MKIVIESMDMIDMARNSRSIDNGLGYIQGVLGWGINTNHSRKENGEAGVLLIRLTMMGWDRVEERAGNDGADGRMR